MAGVGEGGKAVVVVGVAEMEAVERDASAAAAVGADGAALEFGLAAGDRLQVTGCRLRVTGDRLRGGFGFGGGGGGFGGIGGRGGHGSSLSAERSAFGVQRSAFKKPGSTRGLGVQQAIKKPRGCREAFLDLILLTSIRLPGGLGWGKGKVLGRGYGSQVRQCGPAAGRQSLQRCVRRNGQRPSAAQRDGRAAGDGKAKR